MGANRTLSIHSDLSPRWVPLVHYPLNLYLYCCSTCLHHPPSFTSHHHRNALFDTMQITTAFTVLASLVSLSQAFEITFPNSNGGYWVVSEENMCHAYGLHRKGV